MASIVDLRSSASRSVIFDPGSTLISLGSFKKIPKSRSHPISITSEFWRLGILVTFKSSLYDFNVQPRLRTFVLNLDCTLESPGKLKNWILISPIGSNYLWLGCLKMGIENPFVEIALPPPWALKSSTYEMSLYWCWGHIGEGDVRRQKRQIVFTIFPRVCLPKAGL